MRIMRIVNVIPNDHSNETNNDTEPNIAVNPNNPREMVITAFTPPDNPQGPGPIFVSTDGGENWSLRFDVPFGEPNDQTVSFASTSNTLYMAIMRDDGITKRLYVLRGTDLSTETTFPVLYPLEKVDRPWVQAISVIGGPDTGRDRIYIGYNEQAVVGEGHPGVQTARVLVFLDGLATAPTLVSLDKRDVDVGLQDGPTICPVAHRDGTVYVAYQGWRHRDFSSGAIVAEITVARDDNWGRNGFTNLIGNDKKAGRIVAPVLIKEGSHLDCQRVGSDLNLAVDPFNSGILYIVWCDNTGPNYTLHVRRSLDRGVNWSPDLITVDNATLACLAINSGDTVGLLYLQLASDQRQWETHFRTTTTTDGTTWDDTLLARTDLAPPESSGRPCIGDYTRLVAVGPHFYGVFPAMNTPDPANFFPNGGGTFRYQRNTSGKVLVGNDGVTPVSSPSVDPFFFKILLPSSLRQFLQRRGIDPRRGLRSIRPPITSVRAFMGI